MKWARQEVLEIRAQFREEAYFVVLKMFDEATPSLGPRVDRSA